MKSICLFLAAFSCAGAMTKPCPSIPARMDMVYNRGYLLDAFAPPGDPRPAAIVIHGRSGNRRTHINQALEVIQNSGWAWFSIDYGSAADIQAAINYIRCPNRFNILPEPVLIGEDTGANLALSVASKANARSVVAFGTEVNPTAADPGVPVLMFHGELDDEFAIGPARAACASWNRCTFQVIPKGIHNLENWHPDQWEWKEDFSAWLRADRRGVWNDIVYQRPGGQPLMMDAFLPQGAGPFPAAIVVHGGGWEAGDRKTYVSPILDVLSHSGFVYFSIDYRLTPYFRNDDQIEDLRSAIRYIRSHAKRFHVNTNQIALLGESAGGQMVTQLASMPCPDCPINAVVSLYGVYDFEQFTKNAEDVAMLNRIFAKWTLPDLKAASPIHHISKSLPRLLLIQGTKDELYPGALAYDQALTAAGVEHKLVILEGAPHGMENWVGHPEWTHSLTDAVAWLQLH